MVKPMSAHTLFERIETVIERPRPFVRIKGFFGPDRRRHVSGFAGEERRRGMKKKKKEMTQDEINVLINPTPEAAESTAIEKKSGGGANTDATNAS